MLVHAPHMGGGYTEIEIYHGMNNIFVRIGGVNMYHKLVHWLVGDEDKQRVTRNVPV